jgi:serine/threonine protein kinase
VSACARRTIRSGRDGERRWAFVPGEEIVRGLHAWSRLGDGRRCETWLAWCVRRWAPVAIKLPRPGRIDARTTRTLAREATMVAPLVHPGLQRLLEVHLGRPLPYLVFEYVEGLTLAERLDEDGRCTPGDVVRLGMQLAAMLHYLHGQGVVHCDLKPTNVVLRDGRAVLIDFDIARRIGERGTGTKAPGSVEYMAPEQATGAPAAPSMDVFALGAVLYEAATDVIAFGRRGRRTGSDPPHLARRPARVRQIAARVPRALDEAIWSLLEPDLQRRPRTALEALALLRLALPVGQEGLWPGWVSSLLPATGVRVCRSEIAGRR